MARSTRGLDRGNRAYRGGRIRSGVRGARRVWPYVLMAWERWQSLSPEEKERYKKQARGYAKRGRAALDSQRTRKPRG
jgi:glycogen debranching enzyme